MIKNFYVDTPRLRIIVLPFVIRKWIIYFSFDRDLCYEFCMMYCLFIHVNYMTRIVSSIPLDHLIEIFAKELLKWIVTISHCELKKTNCRNSHNNRKVSLLNENCDSLKPSTTTTLPNHHNGNLIYYSIYHLTRLHRIHKYFIISN